MESATFETPSTNVPSVSEREGYLGGSDASAILGLSPYASPFSVFIQKRGLDFDRRVDEALQEKFDFGHAMEPVIAARFEKRTGLMAVRPRQEFLRHPELPFLGGHLDFWVHREGEKYPHAILECKNIEFKSDEWGDPDPEGRNANSVAIYYLAQCDHYMALTGIDLCYLAVLFGGCRLVVYPIKRDRAREAVLLEAERRFWQRVVDDEPPDFMGKVDDLTLALQSQYAAGLTSAEAKKSKGVLQLDAGLAALLNEIKQERAKKRDAMKEEHAKVSALLLAMQGKTGYLQVGAEKWGSLLMQDRKTFDDFAFKMKHPDLYQEFEVSRRIGPVLRLRKDDEPITEEHHEEAKAANATPAATTTFNDDPPF